MINAIYVFVAFVAFQLIRELIESILIKTAPKRRNLYLKKHRYEQKIYSSNKNKNHAD